MKDFVLVRQVMGFFHTRIGRLDKDGQAIPRFLGDRVCPRLHRFWQKKGRARLTTLPDCAHLETVDA